MHRSEMNFEMHSTNESYARAFIYASCIEQNEQCDHFHFIANFFCSLFTFNAFPIIAAAAVTQIGIFAVSF